MNGRQIGLIPQDRMKGRALVIQRDRMAGAIDAIRIEFLVWKLQGPEVAANAPGHLIDREPISGHRVPQTQETYLLDLARARKLAHAFTAQDPVANRAERPFNSRLGLEMFRTVIAVS